MAEPAAKRARQQTTPTFLTSFALISRGDISKFQVAMDKGLHVTLDGKPGKLSPLSSVTVPANKKKAAGIPEEAVFFCFAFAASDFPGGFLYFDCYMKLIGVKDLDTSGSGCSFRKIPHRGGSVNDLTRFGRFQGHEVAWIRPDENIGLDCWCSFGGFLLRGTSHNFFYSMNKTVKQQRESGAAAPQALLRLTYFGAEEDMAKVILDFDTWAESMVGNKAGEVRLVDSSGAECKFDDNGDKIKIRKIAHLIKLANMGDLNDVYVVIPNKEVLEILRRSFTIPKGVGTLADNCAGGDNTHSLAPALNVSLCDGKLSFEFSPVPMAVWSVKSNRTVFDKFEKVSWIASGDKESQDFVELTHPIRAHVAYMLANDWNVGDLTYCRLKGAWPHEKDKYGNDKVKEPTAGQLRAMKDEWTELYKEQESLRHMLEQDKEKADKFASLL